MGSPNDNIVFGCSPKLYTMVTRHVSTGSQCVSYNPYGKRLPVADRLRGTQNVCRRPSTTNIARVLAVFRTIKNGWQLQRRARKQTFFLSLLRISRLRIWPYRRNKSIAVNRGEGQFGPPSDANDKLTCPTQRHTRAHNR